MTKHESEMIQELVEEMIHYIECGISEERAIEIIEMSIEANQSV